MVRHTAVPFGGAFRSSKAAWGHEVKNSM